MDRAKIPAGDVADSWEDEEIDDVSGHTAPQSTEPSRIITPPPGSRAASRTATAADSSKTVADDGEWEDHRGSNPRAYQGFDRQTGGSNVTPPLHRPEKTTAVASRLIAAGLGQRAPRRTKEEREYDQAMRLQEKKRRDQAREAAKQAELDAQKAKQAIWDD